MPPTSFPPFKPRSPWLGPDLQTLRNVLRRPALPELADTRAERLELPLADGSDDRLVAQLLQPDEQSPAPADAPLVVQVHGLGGSHESDYMKASAAHLLSCGLRVLQLNLRGAGPSRPLCRSQYHAGRSEDFADALRALPERLTRCGVFAVGYSLGGNMLLKFAAESGGLRGVASVSAPIDLAATSNRFLARRNRVYHLYMLNGMKREALAGGASVSDEERRVIAEVRTILEFDERLVAPRNGFAGAGDYYAKNHARQFLAGIRVPALLIHAQDDPWIPADAYTSFDWSANTQLTPLLPRSGGHLGFHGRESRVPWHDRCVSEFLARV